MTIFTAVRLSIWSIIFACGVVVTSFYIVVAQNVLSREGLNTIATDSEIARTIRTETILPKALQAAQSYEYTALIDDTVVTDTVNETFTDDVLIKKIEPAITSLHDWLDSKEPAITFSLSTADLTTKFSQTLAKKIVEKYQAAPLCTLQNTRAEALAGECRSPFITEASLTDDMQQTIASHPSIQEISTITQDTLVASLPTTPGASDLPTYLNIFYAASIVAAGIAAIVGLWLLLKHRLNGIITLGGGALLASGALLAGLAVVERTSQTLTNDQQAQKIIAVAVEMIGSSLHAVSIAYALIGIALIIIGMTAKLSIARYRRSHRSLHMSSEHH
ncbi:hypothetical protein EON76_01865 [bacterium]|nr:MAG: hypothetical protein EON76_01865 [bacterium]